MEVIERTQNKTCVTSDTKTESGRLFHQADKFIKNVSDTVPLLKIKQENEYVARNNVKDGCNECGNPQEKSDKIFACHLPVLDNIVLNARHRNENGSGLWSNRNSFKQIVENKIPFESHQFISEILEQIGELNNIEKLLLYLKLPKGNEVADPLKQPLNPLGNRLEISQTITWIKSHYEENPNVSIPKQVVYAEYMEYCSASAIKPLSNADFGKVMKQVFSRVRPRRLGTRGNSRYCYSGMGKKIKLSAPSLPVISPDEFPNGMADSENFCDESPQNVVCQWASEKLGCNFLDLTELAVYIKGNHLVKSDKRNEVQSCIGKPTVKNVFSEVGEKLDELLLSKRLDNNLKRKETPPVYADIKEKLIDKSSKVVRRKRAKTNSSNCKEMISKSRKVMTKQNQNCDDINKAVTDDRLTSVEHQSNTVCDNYDPVSVTVDSNTSQAGSHDLKQPDGSTKQKDSLVSFANQKKNSPKRRLKKAVVNSTTDFTDLDVNLINNIASVSEVPAMKDACVSKQNCKPFDSGQTNKLPIPRLPKQKEVATNIIILPAIPAQIKPKQYKRIRPKPEKEEESCDLTKRDFEADRKLSEVDVTLFANLKDKSLCGEVNVGCLEKDALDGYLDGDGNSQEQEEELMKYFQQDDVIEMDSNVAQVKLEKFSETELISQGNINLKTPVLPNLPENFSSPERRLLDGTIRGCNAVDDDKNSNNFLITQNNHQCNKSDTVLPPIINIQSGLSSRRRVSFENLPAQLSNNRRQVCGRFTPISPTDKIKTVTSSESPFLSPRDTSLSRLKSSFNLNSTNLSPLSANVNPVWCSNGVLQPSSLQSSVVSSLSPAPSLRSRNTLNLVKLPENVQKISSFADPKNVVETLSSPLQISSTDQGLFIPPCSPLPPCDSPAFINHKRHSSPNITDKILNKSGPYSEVQTTSLLEHLLLSGKPSDYKALEGKDVMFVKIEDSINSPKSSCSSGRVHSTDPLSQEVSQFFPEEDTQLPVSQFQPVFRSQSVPMVSTNTLISPLSVTQPAPSFFNSASFGSSITQTPVPAELVDFGGSYNTESSSSNFPLAPTHDDPNNVSAYSDQNTEQDNMLLESEITTNLKNIFDLMGEDCKSILISSDNCSRIIQQISKSHPSTPVPSYCNSNNCNKGDPVVSAFIPPVTASTTSQQISRSYPSTPVIPVTISGFSEAITEFLSNSGQNPNSSTHNICDSETDGNINSMIDNSNLFSEDDGLALQSLTADLPDCEDTFDDLEKEVNNPINENDLT